MPFSNAIINEQLEGNDFKRWTAELGKIRSSSFFICHEMRQDPPFIIKMSIFFLIPNLNILLFKEGWFDLMK